MLNGESPTEIENKYFLRVYNKFILFHIWKEEQRMKLDIN